MTAIAIDDTVVREFAPTLIGYARKRVGRSDIAEDLVQETWMAAMGSVDRFAGRSSLRTWLVSILRRKIVDMYRRQRPQVEYAEHHHPIDEALLRLGEHLDDEAAVALIEDELHRLPPRERRAVELCDLHLMDRDDAARAMGVTRNHLRVLLHRGRTRLRTKLSAADHAV